MVGGGPGSLFISVPIHSVIPREAFQSEDVAMEGMFLLQGLLSVPSPDLSHLGLVTSEGLPWRQPGGNEGVSQGFPVTPPGCLGEHDHGDVTASHSYKVISSPCQVFIYFTLKTAPLERV